MKKHPEYGWAVVRLFPGLERTSFFILHHHEAYDGTGYPGELKEDEIPIGARIVSVIDAFDAMVSSRPYRRGLPLGETIRPLNESSGTQFDPLVVRAFIPLPVADIAPVFAAAAASLSTALYHISSPTQR